MREVAVNNEPIDFGSGEISVEDIKRVMERTGLTALEAALQISNLLAQTKEAQVVEPYEPPMPPMPFASPIQTPQSNAELWVSYATEEYPAELISEFVNDLLSGSNLVDISASWGISCTDTFLRLFKRMGIYLSATGSLQYEALKNKVWSAESKELALNLRGKMTAKDVAMLIGKSTKAVGAFYSKDRWDRDPVQADSEELWTPYMSFQYSPDVIGEIVSKLLNGSSITEIKANMDVSVGALQLKLNRMGIYINPQGYIEYEALRDKHWTPQATNLVLHLYKKMSVVDIATLVGRSTNAVWAMLWKHGHTHSQVS